MKTTREISWKASKTERLLIEIIARRYIDTVELIAGKDAIKIRPLDLIMDLTACHANGCKLRLADLAKARAVDLAHDVQGIQRHIERTTGKLAGCFLPRFAAPRVSAKGAK
jgi:hypothetical protein